MKQCSIEFPYFSSILLLRHMTVHSTLLLTSQDHRHQSLDLHFLSELLLLHPSSFKFFALQFAKVSLFVAESPSSFFFRFRFFFVFRHRFQPFVDSSASHFFQIELVVTEQFFVSLPLALFLATLALLFPIEFAFVPVKFVFVPTRI